MSTNRSPGGKEAPPPTLLAELLPAYDARERHALRVAAPPERVFASVKELTIGETPLARLLVRLRGIRVRADRPIVEEAARFGFAVIAEEPGRELVLGALGQPWKLRGGDRPRGDLRTFAEPGYAKMALNFRLDGAVLSTETRVLLTDAASRRAFRRYWLVVRPFSGLIRRLWLRAIASRAAGAGSPGCAGRRKADRDLGEEARFR